MKSMEISDLWTPTGLILGFQMTLFSWRLKEERIVGREGDIPWLTPSDYMNILGMLILLFGIYLLPILGLIEIELAKVLFGLGLFLFVGQAIGTAGHYQLFNRTKPRIFIWFPKQEKIALLLFSVISLIYLIIALLN
jgi:hypothetical protein